MTREQATEKLKKLKALAKLYEELKRKIESGGTV